MQKQNHRCPCGSVLFAAACWQLLGILTQDPFSRKEIHLPQNLKPCQSYFRSADLKSPTTKFTTRVSAVVGFYVILVLSPGRGLAGERIKRRIEAPFCLPWCWMKGFSCSAAFCCSCDSVDALAAGISSLRHRAGLFHVCFKTFC